MEIRREQAMKSGQLAGIVGVSFVALCTVIAIGCGGGGGSTPPLKVIGAAAKNFPIVGGNRVIVTVQQSGVNVVDASVTFKVGTGTAVAVPYDSMLTAYFLPSPPAMAASDSVTLTVTHDGLIATATVTVPIQPVIASPADGSNQSATADIPVTWNTLSPSPSSVRAQILNGSDTKTGTPWAGTAFFLFPPYTISIPANTLNSAQSGIRLDFNSSNMTISLGSGATTDSYFEADYYANFVSFNTN
jgi:hypothetical protein